MNWSIRKNRDLLGLACLVILVISSGLLLANSPVYGAVAPMVSTLSSISDGLVTPVRVAADPAGNMYVTDPRGGGVLKYNYAGNVLQKIKTASTNVLGIAIAKNGDVLVSQDGAVVIYPFAGGSPSPLPGTFGTANCIAVDDTGAIYVTDSTNNNVHVFNADYTIKNIFGTFGSGNGQFKQPTGIAFEKISRQIAVVDTRNGRVQFFATDGTYQKTVGSFGAGPLQFTSPQGIAFEYSPAGTVLSRMYVVDSFQSNIQAIDAATLTFLRYIGGYGVHGGQLVTPGDILLDPLSRLIVPNGTGALAVFGLAGGSGSSGSSTTAPTFPSPSTGVNPPPALTLNPLAAVTSATSLTVSGTTTIGATVTVNGAPATVDGSGNWKLLAFTLTQQGLNSIVVTASKNGSTSSITAYVTLDSVAPAVTVLLMPKSGSTTSTPIQTIVGTVTDLSTATVTVTVNGVPHSVPVADGMFTTSIQLGAGANTIAVTATDAAGTTSTPITSTVTYNPLAPTVAVVTPGGAVSGSASYTVTGTAPLNSQVTVNTVAATVVGTQWSATIPLVQGFNPIFITASVAGAPAAATVTSSVVYDPLLPAIAITTPAADGVTAQATPVISGTVGKGVAVSAALNGAVIPVTVTSDGIFTAYLPTLTTIGTYAVTITAIDGNGALSSTTRSLVYDPTPPAVTVVNTSPASIKISSANGVVVARDKNGVITTLNGSNGTAALDLSGATFDQASLNVYVLSPAGLSSRNGNITGSGTVGIADALQAMQISLGTAPAATFDQKLRGDVGPLVNHVPVPDGKISLDDAILILKKSVGIDW